MDTFGTRLKKCMELRGKRLIDVSFACGISKGNLSRYMNDKLPMPKIDTINKLAAYLEVSPAYLLGISDQMIIYSSKPSVNLDGKETKRDIILKELYANLTWLDDDTLENVSLIVRTLAKEHKQ